MTTLGFTGTRSGMTEAQKDAFSRLVATLKPDVFLHGAAVGADTDAVVIVHGERHDWGGCRIVAHPGKSAKGGVNEHRGEEAIRLSDEVMPDDTHFSRNRTIVRAADLLVATPWQTKEQEPVIGQGGGTWFTVQFARGQRCGVRVIWPNGEVEAR